MILDAREQTPDADLEYDLCIVGAGAAGITLALALADAGLRIVVLESGGLENEAATQALYEGTTAGERTWSLHRTRWRQLGGSTLRWAGWCKPLNEEDFLPRAHIPLSGWPITRDTLLPWYELAQARLQLGDFFYDTAAIAAHEDRPLLLPESARVRTEVFQYSPPTRFGTFYRAALEGAESVDVLLYANVVDILLEPTLSRVSHVHCKTLTDTTFTVRADRFVLACGGIENARVLLSARSQLEEGIANSSDMVGRCFMEHPHYYRAAALVTNPDINTALYQRFRISETFENTSLRNQFVRGTLALSPQTRQEFGLPSFTVELVDADISNAETGALLPTSVAALRKHESSEPRLLRLTARTEQRPDPDNRITLQQDDLDALGQPKVLLNWEVSEEDRRSMRTSFAILGAEFAAAGLGRLWTPTTDGRLDWKADPGNHHLGTTRMTADPSLGVVDADCRSHDHPNLFVLGGSVFATGGDANPTLTITALAERCAAYLRDNP